MCVALGSFTHTHTHTHIYIYIYTHTHTHTQQLLSSQYVEYFQHPTMSPYPLSQSVFTLPKGTSMHFLFFFLQQIYFFQGMNFEKKNHGADRHEIDVSCSAHCFIIPAH